MKKYLSALAVAVALSGCSSSGDGDTNTGTAAGGGTGGPTVNTGGSSVVTGGDPITPSGDIVGAWFGRNNFGDGVMIVDSSRNIYAFSANASGQFETVFGPASEQLERFVHRNSDNTAFADSFTLAGDLPSSLDANAPDKIAYNLSAQNEGQQINNTGGVGDFSMTFASEQDLPPISAASIAGDWSAKTSFCAVDCNITLRMTFTEAGGVSGSTQFNDGELQPLTGTVTAATGATQYLNVSFMWTGKTRTGIVHLDRRDTTRLILNTFGIENPDTAVNASFSASMIKN